MLYTVIVFIVVMKTVAATATPRVFLQSSNGVRHHAALFGRSMFDDLTSMRDTHNCSPTIKRHYEKCFVNMKETPDEYGSPCITLAPSLKTDAKNDILDSNTHTRSWNIPFGRAIENELFQSTKCPTVYLGERNYYNNQNIIPPKAFVSLGAVAVVIDAQNRVLLTRRAKRMRSFPKAWVMPGGGIDSGESFLDGVVREVKEETGLHVDVGSIEPIGMWESCFPTDGKVCVDNGIRGHYLVIFCKCAISSKDGSDNDQMKDVELTLQDEETDAALWISTEEFIEIMSECAINDDDCDNNKANNFLPSANVADSKQNNRIHLQELCGIYPREDQLSGIAQGNLFMLEEFFQPQSML